MKKADMIKTIQEKDVKLFLELKENELLFGPESDIFKSSRSSWCAVLSLMESLDIKSDFSLLKWEEVIRVEKCLSDKFNSDLVVLEKFEEEDFGSKDIGYPL